MKRFTVVLFSVVMVLSFVLSACSGNQNTAGSNTSGNKTADSESKPKQGEPKQEKERELIKLSFFLEGASDTVMPKDDSDFVRKAIEEKFNVKLDTINLTGDDAKQKLNLLISSGDTPDLILTTGQNSNNYHDMGLLGDVSAFANPEVMPNYFKWVTEDQVQQFQYPGHFNRLPRPVESKYDFAYFIRKDWLDNLNLTYPTNYEELTEVMRAFTEDDPDGNGKDDTYGISMPGSGKTVYYGFPQYRYHGLIGTSFVDKNGDFHDSQSDPKIGEVIADIKGWIDAGYVDPDWFLAKSADVGNKFAQGKIGMAWVLNARKWAFDSDPNSYFNQLKAQFPNAEFQPFNPFPEMGMWVEPYPTTPMLIPAEVLEKEPEKAERIIEIIDWLCSEEGYLLSQYGVENKHYKRSGSEIELIPDTYKKDIIDNGNFLTVWQFATVDEPSRLGLKKIDPSLTARDRAMLETIHSFPKEQGLGTSVVTPEGINIGDFRGKLYEYQVKALFEADNPVEEWKKLREELMTTYKGNEIFQFYIEQMREVGIEVNDFK